MGIDRKKCIRTIDALTDALGRSDGQSPDEIKDELRGEGVDIDATLARLKQAQQSISLAAKRAILERARQERLSWVEKGKILLGKYNGWSREQLVERIHQIGGPEVQAAFRDLDKMGDKQIAAILEDLELTNQRAKDGGEDDE